MKKFLFVLFLFVSFGLFAQMTVDILTPQGTFFNYMALATFNPDEPELQPEFLEIQIGGFYTDMFVINIQFIWGNAQSEVNLIREEEYILPLMYTNRDLISTNPPNGYTKSGNYDDIVNQLEDTVYSTGKMPDGAYLISVQIFELNPEPEIILGPPLSDPRTVTFNILSPLTIGLLTPGGPLGIPPTPINDLQPEFVWFSNFTDYLFELYDITGETINSPEDIEFLNPLYAAYYTISSFTYPSVLDDGTYAWRILATSISPDPALNEVMESVFYIFQISQTGTDPLIDPTVVTNLIYQFAPTGTGTQELLNYLNNGYNVQTITWQGQEITLEELMAILNGGQYEPVGN